MISKLKTIQEQINDTSKLIFDTIKFIQNNEVDNLGMDFVLMQDKRLLENLKNEEKNELLSLLRIILPNDFKNATELITYVYGENYSKKIDPFNVANEFGIDVNKDFYMTDGIGKSEFNGEKIVISYRPTNIVRDRFTIAHELGHIFLHFKIGEQFCFIDTFQDEIEDEVYSTQKLSAARLSPKKNLNNNRLEIEANKFAGELLVPKNTVLMLLKTVPRGKAINATILKEYFNVSNDVIRIALMEYELLNGGNIVNNLPNNRSW